MAIAMGGLLGFEFPELTLWRMAGVDNGQFSRSRLRRAIVVLELKLPADLFPGGHLADILRASIAI
jgi:hypothetical protein